MAGASGNAGSACAARNYDVRFAIYNWQTHAQVVGRRSAVVARLDLSARADAAPDRAVHLAARLALPVLASDGGRAADCAWSRRKTKDERRKSGHITNFSSSV